MNKQSVYLLLFLFLLIIFELFAEPRVKIPQGFLKGTILKSRNGRNISSFIGIPYAEPPIGNLRFSSPVPAKSWNGEFLANKEVNSCPQLNIQNGKSIGNEDCLYLNVYTPISNFNQSDFNSTNNNSLLPVMVWIHGGGFFFGSSGPSSYGPNYLLDKDIVLVAMNYRLGVFGFLTTGDLIAPGNFGLKDQVLALKWVQKSIRAFGGDPNHVTIFGESAGGASVNFLVLSNATNGLFHQYIIESGTAISPWAYQNKIKFRSQVNEYARKMNCPINNSSLLVECLRDLQFEKLVENSIFEILDFPKIPWVATDELISKDAFLTESPIDILRKRKIRDLPFMTGTVSDEGLLVTRSFYFNFTSNSMQETLDKCINSTSDFYLTPINKTTFRKTVNNFYFNKSLNQQEILQNYTNFVTDSGFFYSHIILMEKMLNIIKSPIYFYSFGYLGNMNLLPQNVGVHHAAELAFLFPKISSNNVSKSDSLMIDLMVDFWTSFAMNGKPTSRIFNAPTWPSYNKNKNFLQIGNIKNNSDPLLTIEKNYFVDRINFWKDNFPM